MTKLKALFSAKNAKWAYHVRDEHKKHLFGVWGDTPHNSREKKLNLRDQKRAQKDSYKTSEKLPLIV